MKYSLDAGQMKLIDDYSINTAGIPSLVLMERAALAVAGAIRERYGRLRVAAVCGAGNNGADALCCIRILDGWGYDTAVYFAMDMQRATDEMKLQKKIADNLGIKTVTFDMLAAYDVIVDGIFGIGLAREITGDLADVVKGINKLRENGKKVIAVDIPSGIAAGDGRVLGCAVRADYTVTFGYMKNGLLLYPGAEYAGETGTFDCGFAKGAIDELSHLNYYYEAADIARFPARRPDSNKGSYGKVLVAAGSKNMCGAAYFAAKAAYRMGAGLVKIFTSSDNRLPVKSLLPEAVLGFYDETDFDGICELVNTFDCIIIGPGLSVSDSSKALLLDIFRALKLKKSDKQAGRDTKVILDADALNIIARDNLFEILAGTVITPHMGEMSRLTGLTVDKLKSDIIYNAAQFSKRYGCICVLKDSRSIVTDGSDNYINVSGNNGMATAGSGDVLTGIIAGAYANGMSLYEGAALAVYIHGCAGDAAADALGQCYMTASDIIDHIGNVLLQK